MIDSRLMPACTERAHHSKFTCTLCMAIYRTLEQQFLTILEQPPGTLSQLQAKLVLLVGHTGRCNPCAKLSMRANAVKLMTLHSKCTVYVQEVRSTLGGVVVPVSNLVCMSLISQPGAGCLHSIGCESIAKVRHDLCETPCLFSKHGRTSAGAHSHPDRYHHQQQWSLAYCELSL